jgi:hypothetical protein
MAGHMRIRYRPGEEGERDEQTRDGSAEVTGYTQPCCSPDFAQVDVVSRTAFPLLASAEVVGQGGEPMGDVSRVVGIAVLPGVLKGGSRDYRD